MLYAYTSLPVLNVRIDANFLHFPSSFAVFLYHYNAIWAQGMNLEQSQQPTLRARRSVSALPFSSSQPPWEVRLSQLRKPLSLCSERWQEILVHTAVRTRGCGNAKPLLCLHTVEALPLGVWLASVLRLSCLLPLNSLGHRKLKTRLQHLRWKGREEREPGVQEKSCARCRQTLGGSC